MQTHRRAAVHVTIREMAVPTANKIFLPCYSVMWRIITILIARAMSSPTTTPARFTDRLHAAAQRAGHVLQHAADRVPELAPDARLAWRRRLALAQGGYYVVTGAWPFLHMRSFEAVTGPKTDHWLVQTVGALVGTLGGGLLASGRRGEGPSRDLAAIAATTAAGLALLEGTFVAQRRIAPVYLLDAAAELALVAGWIATSDKNAAAV